MSFFAVFQGSIDLSNTLGSRVQRICSWARKHWWVGVLIGAPVMLFDGLPTLAKMALGLTAGLIFALGWLDDIGREADNTLSENGKPKTWNEDVSDK